MHAGQLDVEVVGAGLVDEDVVGAEGLGVGAEVDGDGVVIGGDAEEGGPEENHDEPAAEGGDVQTLPGEQFGVVHFFEEGV